MRNAKTHLLILLFSLIFSACASPTENATLETEATEPTAIELIPARLVISEVMAGAEGNNRYDFIELYNAGDLPADLKGHSLWYQLKDGDEEILIYRWNETTLVPPRGHFLLGQEGQDFGVMPDVSINQSLALTRGGLILKTNDQTIDLLAWGTGPAGYTEGSPATAIENGASIERAPGAAAGNGTDSDDNLTDFIMNHAPTPQNSGSSITPAIEGELVFSVITPEIAEPGTEFEISLNVENLTGQALDNLTATMPIPELFSVAASDEMIQIVEGIAEWSIARLEDGDAVSATITIVAPWTFTEVYIQNTYAQAENWPIASFNGQIHISISGGSIPIATARELTGMEVVVEGTATMYTGGLYAGSGTKFYIEDETGGIQIYVPGAATTLNIPIGTYVKVQGRIEPYRGAIELIPASIEQVEILQGHGATPEWEATEVGVGEANSDVDNLPGKLVQVEGTIARVEEFSYSYEIDMIDDSGQLLLLYIDKLTTISVETIESGQKYRVLGISELLDDSLRVYPRLQSDLTEIFPPILMIESNAPTTATQGESFTIEFTAYNHTPETISNLQVSTSLADGLIQIVSINDGGVESEDGISWTIAELAGEGARVTVSFEAQVNQDGFINIDEYSVTADGWSDPTAGQATYTFIGDSVPIWAIQGSGARSSYILRKLTTQGVITAVVPEMEGFWLQERVSDDDPNTSAAIFVYYGAIPLEVKSGDMVSVFGLVREVYQQTQITVFSKGDVEILSENNALPKAIELDPPANNQASAIYFESLEGMLVQITGPAIAVGPTNRYGEFALVLAAHDTTHVWQYADNGMVIRVDDSSNFVHETQESMVDPVSVGDEVSGVVGPLAYTFGNFKIEPITAYEVNAQTLELPIVETLAAGQFSIMTWNVENLFDIQDPHPSSPPMPSLKEYKLSITKVANTILAAGAPTVIGLQEVENIGILEDIAEHEVLAAYGYQPVLIEGSDSRGIDVGYLVREDQAVVVEEVQYPAPAGLTSRPPLMLHVEINVGAGPIDLFLLNNHFTSMSGGEQATEPRRNAQAAWNVTVMEEILSEHPNAYLAVIGDLNSYYDALPIDTLREAGLAHVFEIIEIEERYTYIYQGVSQVLDHILVTSTLMDLLSETVILHTNADYPLPPVGDETPLHKSDHDPVIAIFTLP